jgi:1-phosphatidylinositol-4-phosphate 5-kinase
LKDEELELLAKKGVLEKYYSHVNKNPKSLLARFYGIFTVKIKFMKAINIIIMDNLMGEHREQISRVYDLKGSTFQRIANNVTNTKSVRKDLNFLEETEYRVHVDEELHKDLLRRMAKDKEFLKSCHLMDYSLLVVFFKSREGEQSSEGSRENSRTD